METATRRMIQKQLYRSRADWEVKRSELRLPGVSSRFPPRILFGCIRGPMGRVLRQQSIGEDVVSDNDMNLVFAGSQIVPIDLCPLVIDQHHVLGAGQIPR